MKHKTDILVAGGGPAGVAAAVAAGRKGARVTLVERYGFLGGTATSGLYGALCGFYTSGEKQEQVIKGIAGELVDTLNNRGALSGPLKSKEMVVLIYDLHFLKLALDRLLLASGVDILLHSCASGINSSEGTINSVTVVNKSGVEEIEAAQIVDATGDADLAAAAGAPFAKEAQSLQPGSMMFKMAGVDMNELFPFVLSGQLHQLLQEVDEKGEYNLPRIDGNVIPQPHQGQVVVGFSRINVDGTDARSITEAEIAGRSQVEECIRFLTERVPGFKDAYLAELPAQVGIRESRRIIGEYQLTLDDVLSGSRFSDAIGRCAWPVEQHLPGTKITRLEALEGDNYYQLPFRSLVPQKIDNLLVAGRCSSSTAEAQASTRVFAPSMAQGQACGLAACLAVNSGVKPKDIDIEKLQDELKKQGAII